MKRFTVCAATFGIALWACDVVETPEVETSTTEQAGRQLQGRQLQGRQLQGRQLQGSQLQGMRLSDATLSGATLANVRVSRGELLADCGGTTLRGTALAGTHLRGQVQDGTTLVDFRITAVAPESSGNDPTGTGHTFLYTIEQWVDDTSSWEPACDADDDGRRVAIPVAAIWNEQGDRVESSSLFTFGCTTGVIAKCYRWGYRPWITGYGDSMVAMHQTCTRLARADYCGIGVPGTRDGTKINVWDRLPSPGPIQRHGGGLLGLPLPPPGMLFEAGWNTNGAVCLSTARWLLEDGIGIARLCPDRLVPPGLLLPTVCDAVTAVFVFDANARMFNESLNL
jgi:hypothetical protein